MRTLGVVAAGVLLASVLAGAMQFEDWSQAVSLESVPGTDSALNTVAQDGCPAPSKDGLTLYMASNRPGGQGGLDIWAAYRESADECIT